ncbi:response regulator [Desulfatibacillum aliphaticivorans]|uniref:response regulator n=1 Tax=Desulfatibacillum aliphaticivorans TaxID=218208 RepID=UPI000406AC16|nr:response regulator [Desulfatibacillum aliphaticivorans]
MKTILVIDDEKPTLTMFRLLLKAMDYEVLLAESGEEGIALFEQNKPDVVITVIKMPGMDGFEVIKTIREMDAGVPFIIITGHGDVSQTEEAALSDTVGFINKPLQREALEEALEKAFAS